MIDKTMIAKETERLLAQLFILQTNTSVVHMWRGQENADWDPLPTLYRRLLKAQYSREEITEELVCRYETDLLCESNGLGYYKGDRLATLVALQHHGGATRFLDVTRSVFVALWFAAAASSDADGVIFHFGIPTDRVHRYDHVFTLDDIVNEHHKGRPHVFIPRSQDERIKAQQAGLLYTVLDTPLSIANPFLVDTNGLTVNVIRIPYRIKTYLRQYLERSIGLDAVGVFPDFEGYALANSSTTPFAREPDELYDGRDGLFPNRDGMTSRAT